MRQQKSVLVIHVPCFDTELVISAAYLKIEINMDRPNTCHENQN